MVRQLRTQTGRRINGLVLANGGILTYQHVVLLSNQPRKDGSSYPKENPLPPVLTDEPTTAVDDVAEGEAMIEVSKLAQYLYSRRNPKLLYTDLTRTTPY